MGISQETEKYSKVTTELIEHMNEWIGNYPQVTNPPISNDILLVPDLDRPGKKTRVSKLLLQISICELHNDLMSESNIHQLKKAVDETIGKPLIRETALRAIMPKNVRKIIDRYKQTCGCKICAIICYMQASLPFYR